MERKSTHLHRNFFAIALGVLVVGGICLARPLLMPVAFGIVLAFALAPVVRKLEQLRVPTVLAVVVVVGGVLLIASGITFRVGQQFSALLHELPDYSETLKNRIASLGLTNNSTFDRLWQMYEDLSAAVGEQSGALGNGEKQQEPVIVREASGNGWAWNVLDYVMQLGGALIVIAVLVIFLLIEKANIRDRILAVAGTSQIATSTRMIEEVGDRLGRYLFWLCVLNASFAVIVGIAFYLMEIPYAMTWATLTGLLRFVPWLGSPLSMLFPMVMALIVHDGWMIPLVIVGMYAFLEFASGNFVEPYLIGRSIGLNSIAVIFAIMFWGWAWGAPGIVLALPLTLTCVVFAKHMQGLGWLNTLLGIDSPLPGRYSLYQRLIAGDVTGASGMLQTNATWVEWGHSMDELLAPALVLTRNERDAETITEAEFQAALVTAAKVSEDARSRVKGTAFLSDAARQLRINVLAPEDPSDEVIVGLVVPFLEPWCTPVTVVDNESGNRDTIPEEAFLHIVCMLPKGNMDDCVELCQRIREQDPKGRIIVLYWKPLIHSWKLQSWIRARVSGRVHLVTGLVRLVPVVRQFCERATQSMPAPVSAPEAIKTVVGPGT